MSAKPAFDSLTYEEALIASGIEPQQARAHRTALALVLTQATDDLVKSSDLAAFEARLEKRFDALDRRFEAMDRRFDSVDHRFDNVDQRFNTTDEKFERVKQENLAAVNAMAYKLSETIRVQGFAIVGASVAIVGVAIAAVRVLFPGA